MRSRIILSSYTILLLITICSLFISVNASASDKKNVEVSELRNEVVSLKNTVAELQKTILKQQAILEELQRSNLLRGGKSEDISSKKELKTAENGSEAQNVPTIKTNEKENNEEFFSDTGKSEYFPQTSSNASNYFQNFNPKISAIGDFTAHLGNRGIREKNNDRFSLREVELAFSATIDPYARGDFFLSLGEDNGSYEAEVEEGYITFLTLPADLQLKLGKFKANFGKANTFHTHQRPFVTNPIFIKNYFGKEQLAEPGASLNYLLPNPWDKYIELTLEAFNNGNEKSFAGSHANDLVYLAHLKHFFDISENSTFELGVSAATGPNDNAHGRQRTNLEGIDLTYKWRPLREGLYKSLTWQTEFLASQNNKREHIEENSLGLYSSLQYQFLERWSTGLRYDFSEFPHNSAKRENAYTLNLTFAQSEFAFLRFEYRNRDRNFSKNINEFWLQMDFGIGPHRAHKY